MASATIINLAAHRRLQAVHQDCYTNPPLPMGADPSGGDRADYRSSHRHLWAQRWSAALGRSLHNPHDFMAATRNGYAIDDGETVAAAIHKLAMGDE
ncbi:MAG: hypothetical protein AAF556_08475, partial [Pseudomonadota bacterium]